MHRGKKEWGLGYKFTFQILKLNCRQGFQHGAGGKEPPAMPQIRDATLTPELEDSLEEDMAILQYSHLKNPMD